jgi:hypothetical protein
MYAMLCHASKVWMIQTLKIKTHGHCVAGWHLSLILILFLFFYPN